MAEAQALTEGYISGSLMALNELKAGHSGLITISISKFG